MNHLSTKGLRWCPHGASQNPVMKTPEILLGLFCPQTFFLRVLWEHFPLSVILAVAVMLP